MTRSGGRQGGERRHTITILEIAEAEAQGEDYCGNINSQLKVTSTLPCYEGLVQGKPALIMIDTGATVNLVNRAFLDDYPEIRKQEDATTI